MARLYVLGAALLFSTGGAAIKLSELTPWQISAFRSGLAALLLWCLLPEWRMWWRPHSLVVGFAFGMTLILFVTANTLTTAANAIFLQYSAPVLVLLLSPLLLGEKNCRSDFVFVGAMATGMLLLLAGQDAPTQTSPAPRQGNLVAACTGITWALAIIGLRWLGRQHDARETGGAAIVAGNIIALLVCLPFALPLTDVTTIDWAVLLYLGVFQVAIAYLCLVRGVRHLRAFEVSLLLALEPVASGVWAWLIHGEIPSTMATIGCAVIFFCVVGLALRRNQTS